MQLLGTANIQSGTVIYPEVTWLGILFVHHSKKIHLKNQGQFNNQSLSALELKLICNQRSVLSDHYNLDMKSSYRKKRGMQINTYC